MTRLVSLPHLQTAAVQTGPWLVSIRGETMPVPELLKGWDFATPLRFECPVSVDLPTVLDECGLGEDSQLAVTAVFWSSSTNRRALGASAPVDRSGEITMSFDVDPSVVGGRLTLQRQLVLVEAGTSRSVFAAAVRGAILWDEARTSQTTVVLEGEAARFPTEVLDFAVGPVAEPSAAWWLDHDFSDLDASPLASMRLFVNGSHPTVRTLLAGTDSPVVDLLSAVMGWDVGRSMVNAALDSPEFIDGWGQFRAGSLGETLELLIRRIWPTHDARALRSMRAQDAGLFEARMQGRLDATGSGS